MFEPQPPMTPPPSGNSPFTPPPPPFAPEPPPVASELGGASPLRTMPTRFMGGEPGGVPHRSRAWVVVVIVAVSVLIVGAAAYLLLSGNILSRNSNTNTTVTNQSNQNTNSNANANNNANANVNSNANANTNANANNNANVTVNNNANTNTNASANTNGSLSTGSPLPGTADADNDGLTDVEEALYGSNAAKSDTDGDSFIDGRRIQPDGSIVGEVALGYDPTAANRKLDAAGLVRTYESSTGGYAVWFPSPWVAQADSSGTGVTFVPDKSTGEFFQISVTDNPSNLTAKQWYQSLNPGLDLSNEQSFLVNGLDAFQSLDDSTVFYSRGGKVYSFNYNTDGRDTVNYRTTFVMAFRSFHLVLNSNSNANTNQ